MIIIAIFLLGLAGIVAILNTEILSLNLYFTSVSFPAWLIYIGFLLMGMLIAALFSTSKGARNRQIIKNKNQEIKRAEAEKEETIERIEREKDLQLALQDREAEIKDLESKLAQEADTTTRKKTQVLDDTTNHSVREQDQSDLVEEEKITEYTIHSSEDLENK